jgi:hypothetical protein
MMSSFTNLVPAETLIAHVENEAFLRCNNSEPSRGIRRPGMHSGANTASTLPMRVPISRAVVFEFCTLFDYAHIALH